MFWKQFRLGNNLPLPTNIRENTDFCRQKTQQYLSAAANLEGCLMVKNYMTLILLLYYIKW